MSNVLIESDPSPMKLEILNVDDWPLTKEACGVTHRSNGATEMHYIVEGAGEISTDEGDHVRFSAGDMVTVMPDTTSTWNITEAIQRHSSSG